MTLWRARSWLYRNPLLRGNSVFSAFFKLFKICALLHRAKLKETAECAIFRRNFDKFWSHSARFDQTLPYFGHILVKFWQKKRKFRQFLTMCFFVRLIYENQYTFDSNFELIHNNVHFKTKPTWNIWFFISMTPHFICTESSHPPVAGQIFHGGRRFRSGSQSPFSNFSIVSSIFPDYSDFFQFFDLRR